MRQRSQQDVGKVGIVALLLLGNAIAAELQLWYAAPAKLWTDALPVGNGRLGAMVFGGTSEERIQFNESTIWTGKPHAYHNDGAAAVLPQMRALLQQGRTSLRASLRLSAEGKKNEAKQAMADWRDKQKAAEQLGNREFMGEPLRMKEYQPFGEMKLRFSGHEQVLDYRRDLDLRQAIATTTYRVGEVRFRRELLASYPDQVVALHLSASEPKQMNFSVTLSSPHAQQQVRQLDGGTIALIGAVESDGVRFQAQLRMEAKGGEVTCERGTLTVKQADEVTLWLVGASNFKSFEDISADPAKRCETDLSALRTKNWQQVRERHVRDYRVLFDRVELDLGASGAAALPTDQRLAAFATTDDPAFAALLFQYGRYLTIAASRSGGQPSTLQGLWNQDMRPAWGSKYTTNINLQMNYWPVEVTNLAECHQPLFDALKELQRSGALTAKAHYAARGWVLHHNFDLWRDTAPCNHANHGIWVSGAAWLCLHLWEHYQYGLDRGFLGKQAYPLMKSCAEFFQDYLVKDELTGDWISGPSNSPEQGGLVMGPTMDHQIIRSLLTATADAARVLGVDAAQAAAWTELAAKIAPNRIGQHGQLQEWMEDVDDPRNHHRHVSHLWGVYPGAEISPLRPELFQAAKQSLLQRGDEATGWSMGWKINLWARFRDGEHALTLLKRLMRPAGKGAGLYVNLFDAHPPFQIDGNYGVTAGMAEMLLQSHLGEVHLLPALPAAWSHGEVRGLRARGGLTVDVAWREGRVTHYRIKAAEPVLVKLRIGTDLKQVMAETD